MRFSLAMCAALAALALGPPLVANQGYMFSDHCFVADIDFTGQSTTSILPGADQAVFDQEVQATSATSRVVGLTNDFKLRALPPAAMGTIETDTSPGAADYGNDMNLVYDLRAIDRAGTFKGHVILKTGHAAPANYAGNSYWIENFKADRATANYTVLKIG